MGGVCALIFAREDLRIRERSSAKAPDDLSKESASTCGGSQLTNRERRLTRSSVVIALSSSCRPIRQSRIAIYLRQGLCASSFASMQAAAALARTRAMTMPRARDDVRATAASGRCSFGGVRRRREVSVRIQFGTSLPRGSSKLQVVRYFLGI